MSILVEILIHSDVYEKLYPALLLPGISNPDELVAFFGFPSRSRANFVLAAENGNLMKIVSL